MKEKLDLDIFQLPGSILKMIQLTLPNHRFYLSWWRKLFKDIKEGTKTSIIIYERNSYTVLLLIFIYKNFIKIGAKYNLTVLIENEYEV